MLFSFFKGVLETRLGSLELKIGSLESENCHQAPRIREIGPLTGPYRVATFSSKTVLFNNLDFLPGLAVLDVVWLFF